MLPMTQNIPPPSVAEDKSPDGGQVIITQTGNENLLLSNLQKLEEAGKVISPAKEVISFF